MRGQPPISRIYKMGEQERHSDTEMFSRLWRWCRDLWRVHGTIAVKPDELPEHLQQPMIKWANDNYGQKRKTKQSL